MMLAKMLFMFAPVVFQSFALDIENYKFHSSVKVLHQLCDMDAFDGSGRWNGASKYVYENIADCAKMCDMQSDCLGFNNMRDKSPPYCAFKTATGKLKHTHKKDFYEKDLSHGRFGDVEHMTGKECLVPFLPFRPFEVCDCENCNGRPVAWQLGGESGREMHSGNFCIVVANAALMYVQDIELGCSETEMWNSSFYVTDLHGRRGCVSYGFVPGEGDQGEYKYYHVDLSESACTDDWSRRVVKSRTHELI